jgi:hypothetical protein
MLAGQPEPRERHQAVVSHPDDVVSLIEGAAATLAG